MARIYPPRLPDAASEDAVSPAERVLFEELAAQLPADYTVLHSVHWLARAGGRTRDGEADFVIAHPRWGVLILEVKGGAIRRDGATLAWSSRDRRGVEHAIKDPFEQAERSMYALRDKLRDAPATRPFGYPLARAVAFPDVLVGDTDLGPNAPRAAVIDSGDLATLARALRRAWEHPAAVDREPGEAGVAVLTALLKPSLELVRPGLVGAMRREGAELLRLTEQQYALLDFLGGHRRVAIDGAAGSGKTVLALEQCRRLARQGFRVLFTCYNKALAGFAREALAADLGPAMARVTVDNYHDLAAAFARRAGIVLPPEGTLDADALARFFRDDLPEHLLTALTALPDRFDAVIVDEGQDFADTWWLTLEALLADPANGILFIFYDDNQRIYETRGDYPLPRPHFQLTHNCRTTRRIHEAAMIYHTGPDRPDCRGPEGRAVIETGTAPEGELAALRGVLHELVAVEGVPLDEIVVLTPRGRKTSRLQEGAQLGNLALTWEEGGPNAVRCRSIHTFKGLESPIVILAEPERAHAANRAPLLYVALSRARHHLIVLGRLSSNEIASSR